VRTGHSSLCSPNTRRNCSSSTDRRALLCARLQTSLKERRVGSSYCCLGSSRYWNGTPTLVARWYSQIAPKGKLRLISVTDVISSAVWAFVGDDHVAAAKTGTIGGESRFRYSLIVRFPAQRLRCSGFSQFAVAISLFLPGRTDERANSETRAPVQFCMNRLPEIRPIFKEVLHDLASFVVKTSLHDSTQVRRKADISCFSRGEEYDRLTKHRKLDRQIIGQTATT
jgi:hypothetical protein